MAGQGASQQPLPSTPDRRPPIEAFYGAIIELQVGSGTNTTIFRAHKDLLNFYSGYFQAATNGEFSEATSRRIELLNTSVEIVSDFMAWLYTRALPKAEEQHDTHGRLCKLWLWADYREIPLLANMVIDAIRDELVHTWEAPDGWIKYVYKNTIASCKLRKLLVMLIGGTSRPADMMSSDTLQADYTKEALWDLLRVVWERQVEGITEPITREELAKMELCHFHSHEEGVKCARKEI